jgi:polar amino acid transport system permease protein
MFENLGIFVRVLLEGVSITVLATLGGIALTIVLAFVAGLGMLSPSKTLRVLSRIYVEGLRGTSEVVQLFWIFFALPLLVGFQIVPIWAGILVLGLNHGAYGAEIVRGALQSVPRAQVEGAIALSLTPTQRMVRVLIPQAIVEMLPPFNTLFIQLLKSSALLSFVSIAEMTTLVNQRLAPNFQQDLWLVFLVELLFYLALALVITAVMRLLESAAAARVGRKPSPRSRTAAKTTAGVA